MVDFLFWVILILIILLVNVGAIHKSKHNKTLLIWSGLLIAFLRVLELDKPLGTMAAGDNEIELTTAFIAQHFKSPIGHQVNQPLNTITTVNKASLVTAFLTKYYGSDIGQSLEGPLHTVTTKDRFGLVTIKGHDYKIVDIGLRMLQPHELFAAQGFPTNYVIDKDFQGNQYSKSKQVARCSAIALGLILVLQV